MKREGRVEMSLADQVVQETLGMVLTEKEFDKEIVAGLEQAFKRGDLKRADAILSIIRPARVVE